MKHHISLAEAIRDEDLAKVYDSLGNGADPHARIEAGPDFYTPWDCAFSCKNSLIMLALLENEEHPANPNEPIHELVGMTAIFGTIIHGNEGILKLLVNEGANVNACDHAGYSPIYLAVSLESRLSFIPLLLGLGADVTVGHQEIADHLEIEAPENLKFFYQSLGEHLDKLESQNKFKELETQVFRIRTLRSKGISVPAFLVERTSQLMNLYHWEEDDQED